MEAIELARKLAALDSAEDARRAYTLAIQQGAGPAEVLEAALYILQTGGDYKVSYTCFRDLYNQGHFREDILSVMTEAFYNPNLKEQQKRYEGNCRLLRKYPYIFRKDFLPFEELPIVFFPYDDNGYIPFYPDRQQFGEYINFKNPVISRNFFRDLEKPVLADDVYSQYELEYLNDNVRKSEYVGRENHVYLHYADWGTFCAHLACLNLRALLEEEKLFFLIGEEIAWYPIDFKTRFGIDYSRYPVKRVGVREVNRLILHTQLSSHNGGDFFNEIFDNHPNLLAHPSMMLEIMEKQEIDVLEERLNGARSLKEAQERIPEWAPEIVEELYRMKNRTKKDIMVGAFFHSIAVSGLDPAARIVPAVFFQPHFENVVCTLKVDERGNAMLETPALELLHQSQLIRNFKYIKTFTPLRRFTTSYAASVKFMYQYALICNQRREEQGRPESKDVVTDVVSERVFNRSFMVDPEDRIYKDSVLVRFEDGKLNPKAAFMALAAFLDLPYTQSMTYCSFAGKHDPDYGGDYAVGFDPSTVYRTYDDFANDAERYFVEYFLRDAYEYYGYDFHYYDGAAVDEAKLKELLAGFTTMDHYIRETWNLVFRQVTVSKDGERLPREEEEKVQARLLEEFIESFQEKRLHHARTLASVRQFVNGDGQPLRFMRKLELDPALLERPLYC